MKISNLIFSVLSLLFITGSTIAQSSQHGEAPYFITKNVRPGDMPLESNKATVYISGIIADVTLEQTYRNNSDSIIEAMYVFPGSSQSAVYDMEMQIGDRIVKAELKEKEEARRTYENAIQEGKRASLLEQHRPNVFQMNVANVLPGEQIIVRLKYTEKIIPEHGDYEFVLPTVVGPRFHESSSTNPATFASMPYSRPGKKPAYTYEIDVYLQSGQAIQKIASPSHQITTKKFNEKIAHTTLSNEERHSGNKDFSLSYRLADHTVNAGLLLYEHEDENFFMANIQPPNFISKAEMPAKEYIFIVDISGSMYGFPLEVSKKLMKDLLKALRPTDKFNVLLFAGTSYMFSDTSMHASASNIDNVVNNLENRQGSGGTRLLPALEKAINFPRPENGLNRSLVVVTDGYITVEKEAFDLINTNLHKANVFAFGIGSSTNRFLIEGLANVGQGIPFIVEKEEEACDIAEKFKEYISTPSLSNITVRYEGFQAYDVEPKSIPDLLGERPINIVGKWKGSTGGKIHFDGYFAGNKVTQTIDLNHYKPDNKNAAIRLLWAREKLRLLDDYRKISYDETHKEEMLQLSLKYNLLSAYTSFVAVDYEVVRKNGQSITKVKQALPLPEGVSEQAIGAEMEITNKMEAPKTSFLKIGKVGGTADSQLALEIRKKFILNLRSIKKLLAPHNMKSLLITLSFDEEGMLDEIEFDSKLDTATEAQLKKLIQSWDFSTLNIDPKSDILVPITL